MKEKPNALQIAGKDNLCQQSAMWQAMLLSRRLATFPADNHPWFYHKRRAEDEQEFGECGEPFEIVEKYGTDALRFFLAHNMSPFEDSDFFGIDSKKPTMPIWRTASETWPPA